MRENPLKVRQYCWHFYFAFYWRVEYMNGRVLENKNCVFKEAIAQIQLL